MRYALYLVALAAVPAFGQGIAVPSGYDASLAPGLVAWANGSCPGPTLVQAQLHVTKMHTIDEKKETISVEAYFRLWWTDARLAGLVPTGCAQNRSYGSRSGIWFPDTYFNNAVRNTIAANFDGEALTLGAGGEIWWSARARMTLDCAMDFWKMPFDQQECPIELGLYRSKAKEVVIEWKHGAKAVDFANVGTTHWDKGVVTSKNNLDVYDSGSYSSCTAYITLIRKTSALLLFAIVVSIIFVLAGYMGFYISPAAAPGRIALAFLCFLMVLNNTNAVRGALPAGLSVSGSWLLLFMFYCMMFNMIFIVEFAMLNFGLARHAANEAKAKKESAKKQEDGGVSVEDVVVKTQSWDEQVAKLRHLDTVCRWLFPLLFSSGILCILLPLFFVGPLTVETVAAR